MAYSPLFSSDFSDALFLDHNPPIDYFSKQPLKKAFYEMLVDTHAHLDFDQFGNDREECISRAWAAGVRTIIIPGIDGESVRISSTITEKHPHIWFAVGWHPHNAENFDPKIAERSIKHPKCVAVGEIGLDFYRGLSSKKAQERVFRDQLELARDSNLPVIIHVRNAWPETRHILDSYPEAKGVLHAFSGSEDDLSWALTRGFYIGVGGPVTFNNFKKQDLIAKIPIEKLLIETDSPYLAPQNRRGKRNEPAYIPEIAEKLADIMAVSIDDMSEAVCGNASTLFGIPLPRFSRRGDAPKSSLSQNFLVDRNIARKICGLAGEGALCVEIGAGNGELTRLLKTRFEKVWAIEPDWGRIENLSKIGVVILPRFFQDVSLTALTESEGKPCVVVGNLPYGDTSSILFHLLGHRAAFEKAVITVQKEFAERLTADIGTKNYGIPTVLLGLFFDIKSRFEVTPECFRPVPQVKSTVLTLDKSENTPGEKVDFDSLKTTIRAAFAHRRKKIRNSMRLELPDIDVDDALEDAGIYPDSRAETVPPDKFVELARYISISEGVV